MNEIWNARREKLEKAVIDAALALFAHSGGAGAFKLPVKGTNPEVFIVAGDTRAVESLMLEEISLLDSPPIICGGCGGEINPDYGKCRRCG